MAMNVKPYNRQQIEDLIRHSVSIMDPYHKRWRMLEALYRTGSLEQAEQARAGVLHEFFPALSSHHVNMVLPHINIIMASVVTKDPQFVATAVAGGEEAEKNAFIAEAIINYFWSRARATNELRDATADAVKLGSGFLKVGWTHLEEERNLDELERKEMALDEYERERLSAILEDREEAGQIEAIMNSVPHSTMRVIKSEPFIEYVSPYDIFVPQNTRRMDDVRWVAHRLTLPVDEILSNPEFDVDENSLVRDGTTVNPGDEYQAEWRRQAEDARGIYDSHEALDTATIWEFYDMRTRQLTVMQLNSKEVLWEGPLPWSHRYSPFVHLRNFRSTGNDFWGFGDLENIANIQHMFNIFLTEQLENARRSGQKYLIRKDAITDDLIAALEASEADVVAPVDIPNGEPLNQVLVPVFRQALSGDLYTAKLELQNYMQEVLGINDFQAGGVGADRMSATAAAVVEGVATLRAQDKIQSIESAAAQVGNIILRLCQEYLDEPTAIRVSGLNDVAWPEVSKSDIFGEYDVTIEGGSMKALNPAAREQSAMRTINEIVPMLMQLGYDPTPALRSAMRDLGYDPEEILIQMPPEPMPMEPQQQGAPSNGDMMAALGGPPQAAQAQAAGNIAL
jgi:hypothetical protein